MATNHHENYDETILERGSDKAFYEDMLEKIKWQRGNQSKQSTRSSELQLDLSLQTNREVSDA